MCPSKEKLADNCRRKRKPSQASYEISFVSLSFLGPFLVEHQGDSSKYPEYIIHHLTNKKINFIIILFLDHLSGKLLWKSNILKIPNQNQEENLFNPNDYASLVLENFSYFIY